MTNTNDDSAFSETPLPQSRRVQYSGKQQSKFMFEGYFVFNTVFLQVKTNNKQLCINTLLSAVKYLNQFR